MSQYFSDRLASERDRLEGRVPESLPFGALPVQFHVRAAGHVGRVIGRATEVLVAVNEGSRGQWPADEDWRRLLPAWFVEGFAPEPSREQSDAWLRRWRSLSERDKADLERNAQRTLLDWIWWLHPDQREWFWWDSRVLDESTGVVFVTVDGWPFPAGSLEWLLRASGAVEVKQLL